MYITECWSPVDTDVGNNTTKDSRGSNGGQRSLYVPCVPYYGKLLYKEHHTFMYMLVAVSLLSVEAV